MKFNQPLTALLILSLFSCGHKTEEKPGTVLSTAQEQTLEKAKQLQDTAKTIEDERIKQLNQAEGNSSTSN